MNRRLTQKQFEVLLAARSGKAIIGHKRTINSLVRMDLLRPVYGWTEKSVARRVGRYKATSRVWGVVGYEITSAGRHAVNVELMRR